MNKTNSIHIILADSQPVFRGGIKSLLVEQNCSYEIGEAGNTEELIDLLLTVQPDLLILDFNPTYFDAEQLTIALAKVPNCKVIIISSQDKKWGIFKSLEFNVYCYLTKECGQKDILKAISMALQGEKFFCTFILDVLLADKRKTVTAEGCSKSCLSNREVEIVRQIALGKVNKEIASILNLSAHTVHTHRRNVMKKLNLHSAVELCSFAIETGIVTKRETRVFLN
jgi:two-component system, NarL family, nitrate/nitrite response regulator NarP